MSLELIPAAAAYERSGSCVLETRFSVAGLYIVVEAYPKGAKTSVHVELFFASHRGFVLLDESDMPSWLTPAAVQSGHVAYEVKSGAWLDGVVHGDSFLQIASAQCREWLVVTSNECVSVFSSHEPAIRELSV